jgi:hypothetical protein
MTYAKIVNGEVVETVRNLQKRFPKTSFPRVLPDQHDGFVKVQGKADAPVGKKIVSREIVINAGLPEFEYVLEDVVQDEPSEEEVIFQAIVDKISLTDKEKEDAREKIKQQKGDVNVKSKKTK